MTSGLSFLKILKSSNKELKFTSEKITAKSPFLLCSAGKMIVRMPARSSFSISGPFPDVITATSNLSFGILTAKSKTYRWAPPQTDLRSEEHTSELQSQFH